MTRDISRAQIVWIFGPSGAGKNTLITKLVSDTSQAAMLARHFKLNGKIFASAESLRGEGRHPDSVRDEIVALGRDTGTSVLIKVQWPEINGRNVPEEVRHLLPDAEHRVIMLGVSPKETVRRLKDDPNPNRKVTSESQAIQFLQMMISAAEKLAQTGFSVLWVNSDTDEYRIIDQETCENLIYR